ncbi:MAG TPA: 6-phosphofructokinase [Firmicutes bacterium]|nr:6-phosphofructokinase [Bacillota bacterium]
MKNLAVLTSGGDAPGMNAAIRAVVRKGIYHGLNMFGIERGFAGLINGTRMCPLGLGSVADIIHRGGTILLTARAPEFTESAVQDKAAEYLRAKGIDGLIIIGGGGSFRGALALQERGIKVAGIPASIDNDIPGTNCSIGFDTAVNTIVDAINRLRDTATSHERVFVIEVMGRDSGFIALAAGLAGGAESVLVPEVSYQLSDICRRLMAGIQRGKLHSIILVAEGAASGYFIGEEIKKRTGLETRVTVLGHLQRGGSPTAADRILASQMGAEAVTFLRNYKSGLITGIRGGELIGAPMEEIFTAGKPFPERNYRLTRILSI